MRRIFSAIMTLWLVWVTALAGPTTAHARVALAPQVVAQEAATTTNHTVEVIDPDDFIEANAEQSLVDYARETELPPIITTVTFIVVRDATSPFDDFVKDYLFSHQEQLIAGNRTTFADGTLTFFVAMGTSNVGIYAGEDVDREIGLRAHPARLIDPMKPPLRNGDVANAFKTGIATTADVGTGVEPNSGFPFAIVSIIGGVLAAGIALMVGVIRRTTAKTAKRKYFEITAVYGDLAQELTALDVRANNLNNPLVNAQLREQWTTIKDNFLAIHEDMMKLPTLTHDSRNRDFIKNAKAIKKIYPRVKQLNTAKNNIELLERLERGDATVRHQEIAHLHEDITEAKLNTTNDALRDAITELDERCIALHDDVDSDSFMSNFAMIISDFQPLVERIQKEEMAAAKRVRTPSIGSSDWRPGVGYGGYVPFAVVSAQVQQASASTTSTTSVSTFSGGFSGAGASSSF